MTETPRMYSDGCYARASGSPDSGTADSYRTKFRRDYGRLLHSASFRRLQGKMQLFPSLDSEFFRNRLTHSLEVAQVAKCIALKLNENRPTDQQINTDLVEFAGIAHDLGHPPFGHVGEDVLNRLMWEHGGFEGNAQTLRILTRLESKEPLFGLDLTLRSLASVLKYDQEIRPRKRRTPKTIKGYYSSEASLVREIKESIAPGHSGKFKTIECDIMDLADDIAYSTYDIEDSFKAKFLTPLDFLTVWQKDGMAERLLGRVNEALDKHDEDPIGEYELSRVLTDLSLRAGVYIKGDQESESERPSLHGPEPSSNELKKIADRLSDAASMIVAANAVCEMDDRRTKYTSKLIHDAVDSVGVEWNSQTLALSRLVVPRDHRVRIEVLKNYAFLSVIESHRIRIVAERGEEIVSTIFESISENPKLLPDRELAKYQSEKGDEKWRVLCDFVACMTDQQAVEFYGRLKSEEHQTIFKPVS